MDNIRKILIDSILLIIVFSILQTFLTYDNTIKLIAFIVSFIIFGLGILVQIQRTKQSNIREKAKKLDGEIIKDLKVLAIKIKKHIDDKNYISFSDIDISSMLELNENEFDSLLNNSEIFKIQENKIVLSYQKDGILKRHANIIIQNIEKYRSDVFYLKDKIKNLNTDNMSSEFEKKLRDLIREEGNELGKGEGLRKLLFITYVVSVSGSKNSYRSGKIIFVNIIGKRYDDLQNIVMNDPKSIDTYQIIDIGLKNIIYCLDNIINEIDNLHEEWQDRLIF